MTKGSAIHAWFNGFGIPFYPATSVEEGAAFPYGTYDQILGAWDSGARPMTANLWYRTDTEAVPNAKAQEMSDALGPSGVLLPCDGGMVWLKRGSPWSQNMSDPDDAKIKRRRLSLTVEFMTTN